MNPPVTGEFTAQRPVTRRFDVFFYLHLNKRLSKQSRGWLFEKPLRPLWRQCDVYRHIDKLGISLVLPWYFPIGMAIHIANLICKPSNAAHRLVKQKLRSCTLVLTWSKAHVSYQSHTCVLEKYMWKLTRTLSCSLRDLDACLTWFTWIRGNHTRLSYFRSMPW